MRALIATARGRGFAILAVLLLAACGSNVKSSGPVPTTARGLPRPMVVVVNNFAVDASAVEVDNGLGGRVRRAVSGTDQAQEQAKAATGAQAAVRDSLIKQLSAMPLPVQAAGAGGVTAPYVEIRGRMTSIDEGNQTRRNLIGLGAGQSDVTATAELYYVAPGSAPILMQSYDGKASSGHMPGLAVGGAGAAAGHVAMAAANTGAHVAEIGKADTDNEAEKLANDLATKLGGIFVQEGWIPSSAVPK